MYEEAAALPEQRQLQRWRCARLQLLESRYPFGKYAEQAQLELIYAHYNAYEHEAAVEAADRFIRLHPQHPNVDYAYYMKGLAAYTGNEDIFARFVPTDTTQRDTSHAKEAFAEFAQLVSRFPASPYARRCQGPDGLPAQPAGQRMKSAWPTTISAAAPTWRPPTAGATWWKISSAPRRWPMAWRSWPRAISCWDTTTWPRDTIAVLALNYPDHPSLDENGEFNSVYTLDGLQRSWINRASFRPVRPAPAAAVRQPPRRLRRS